MTLSSPPFVHRLPQQLEVAVVERIEGAKEDADAALGRDHRADVGQEADAEEQRAEHEAHDEEGLARAGNAGRAERRQGDVDQQPDQRVAGGVADTARHEVAAEILRALRGERREQRHADEAADRRDAGRVERAAPQHQAEHHQVERELRQETAELARGHEAELVVGPQLGLVAELGVGRQEAADEDRSADQDRICPAVMRVRIARIGQQTAERGHLRRAAADVAAHPSAEVGKITHVSVRADGGHRATPLRGQS